MHLHFVLYDWGGQNVWVYLHKSVSWIMRFLCLNENALAEDSPFWLSQACNIIADRPCFTRHHRALESVVKNTPSTTEFRIRSHSFRGRARGIGSTNRQPAKKDQSAEDSLRSASQP